MPLHSGLIHWSDEVIYEPPLTTDLSTTVVKGFITTPMIVPDWPSHTQSVERCVKMVTDAASTVFTYEKRDGMIRGQCVSRALMSRNRSKKDVAKLAQFKL